MSERDAGTRAETVGSLLRPRQVTEALPQDGSLPTGDAVKIFDDAVCEAIRIQEDTGLDVITDGEMRRALWAQTTWYLDCFEPRPGGPGLNWRGGTGESHPDLARYFPAVVRPVRDAARAGNMAGEYAFLAGGRTPGPSTRWPPPATTGVTGHRSTRPGRTAAARSSCRRSRTTSARR
jgi:hypothetical protein